MTNALEIKNLKKSFGKLEVIRGISLTAKKGEVKRQGRDILRKGKETPTGTGQLLGSAFDRDIERVGGKSYTQSKIEEAARTGKYTGF